MITDAMAREAARAMFDTTNTAKFIVWDLLPSHVQENLVNMARVGLEAAEKLRTYKWADEPEGGYTVTPVQQCDHEDMNCPPGECDDLYTNREDMGR